MQRRDVMLRASRGPHATDTDRSLQLRPEWRRAYGDGAGSPRPIGRFLRGTADSIVNQIKRRQASSPKQCALPPTDSRCLSLPLGPVGTNTPASTPCNLATTAAAHHRRTKGRRCCTAKWRPALSKYRLLVRGANFSAPRRWREPWPPAEST